MNRRFAQYLLPGIIFQSVLIGGAYGTGREIVEYGARFGRWGVLSILAIFAGFALTCLVAFEFARVRKAYDYRKFVRELIGPLWPLFDVLFVIMVVVIIAVVSAASGSVLQSVLGWPDWIGFGIVVLAVGLLNALGRSAIERFKTLGTFVLYGGYLTYAWLVLRAAGGSLPEAFEAPAGGTAGEAFGAGVLYVGYNLAVLPSTLFVLDRQTSRKQTIVSALITGVLATVPFALTYLAFMTAYPDQRVFGAEVPWLVLLREHGGPIIVAAFAMVLLWTLIETSTGLIHAVLDRISAALRDAGKPPLTPVRSGVLTVVILVAAGLLSRVGLIGLVAQGYTVMAYAFLLLLVLPLLTRGVAMILRAK